MYVRFLSVGEICSIITEGWEEHKWILGVVFEAVGIWIGNVDLTISLNDLEVDLFKVSGSVDMALEI